MIQVVDKNDLMELIGYPETQASKLIRKAKASLYKKDLNGIRINVLDVTDYYSWIHSWFSNTIKNDIIEENLQSAVMTEGEK